MKAGLGGSGGIGSGGLGGWAVGGTPHLLPDGLAYFLPKGADLVLSTHFHPTGKEERESSTLGLYFTDEEPTHVFGAVQLPPAFGRFADVDIPAGEAAYTKTDSVVLPADVKAFGVSAHAHYLGRSMKMTAVMPDGKELVLLDIPDWDFNWQEQYTFEKFVPLPKGTRINSEVVWDNSTSNPFNPNDPPVRVKWGRESEDEMGSVTLLVCSEDGSAMTDVRATMLNHVRQSFGRGAGGVGRGPVRDAVIKRFDTNKDDKLDAKEIETIRETHKDRPGVLRRLKQLRDERDR